MTPDERLRFTLLRAEQAVLAAQINADPAGVAPCNARRPAAKGRRRTP